MVSGDEICRSNPQFLFEVWTTDNLLVCRSEIFLNFYMKRGIRKTVSELVIDRGRPAKKQLYRLCRPFWQLNTSLRLLRLPERRPIFQRRVGKLRVTTQFICIVTAFPDEKKFCEVHLDFRTWSLSKVYEFEVLGWSQIKAFNWTRYHTATPTLFYSFFRNIRSWLEMGVQKKSQQTACLNNMWSNHGNLFQNISDEDIFFQWYRLQQSW